MSLARALELRQERAGLITEARALLDAAEAENRGLTQEEENQYDRLFDQAGNLQTRAERLEAQVEAERDMDRAIHEPNRPEPEGGNQERTIPEFESRGLRQANERGAFEGREWRDVLATATPEYGQAFRQYLRTGRWPADVRALQADSDTLGGYLQAPVQMVDRLIQAVDDMVYIRQWATVLSVPSAESLGVPTLDTDPADANWTTELGTGSEDSSMAFGKRSLTPHPLAKRIKISKTLLRKVPNVENLVRQRLGYKFGITFEKATLTGSGSQQPLGVFTASSSGISTSRDVSTGNTTTSIKFDGLKEAKWTLKTNYWPRARWLFHRDAGKQIDKLKDGNGQYIWSPSVVVGQPDRLLNIPVFFSEYAPNTFTTGLYVGIIGDFSNYWIADSLDMTMQVLVELYAATNQTGLIGRLESDGMPVLEEAFVRVKLA